MKYTNLSNSIEYKKYADIVKLKAFNQKEVSPQSSCTTSISGDVITLEFYDSDKEEENTIITPGHVLSSPDNSISLQWIDLHRLMNEEMCNDNILEFCIR